MECGVYRIAEIVWVLAAVGCPNLDGSLTMADGVYGNTDNNVQ